MNKRPNTIHCIDSCTGSAHLTPAKSWPVMRTPRGRVFAVPQYHCDTCHTEIVSDDDVRRVERITGIQIKPKN